MALHVYRDHPELKKDIPFRSFNGMYVVHKRPLMYRLGNWLVKKFDYKAPKR